MKKIVLISLLLFSFNIIAQTESEVVWDQGVPMMPTDPYITQVLGTVNLQEIAENKNLSEETQAMLREVGMAFWDKGYIEEAEWYLVRSKGFHFYFQWHKIEKIKIYEEEKKKEEEVSEAAAQSLQADLNFLNAIPKSFDKVSKHDLKKIASEIDNKINQLLAQKDSLLKAKAAQEIIDAKDESINTLNKEKEIIGLTITNDDLKVETEELTVEKKSLKKYLLWLSIGVVVLVLAILVLLQRKTIKTQDSEIDSQLKDINKKNVYLEYAARLIRHDMHSGINTYMPRGIASLEKRLPTEEAAKLKVDSSIKMIKEGLNHTQKVYKSVYEFTNLVKQSVVLDKVNVNLKDTLTNYLSATSYKDQVSIDSLVNANVNELLFCNAIDNLIRNGLKYNDSENKEVKIFMENDCLVVQDNGRGLTQEEFNKICINRSKQKENENEPGLGLNISLAILTEHGFTLSCEKNNIGTKIKINLKP